MPIDPSTLAPGQRVTLYCEKSRHPTVKAIQAAFVGETDGLWAFAMPRVTLLLFALDDGTLRDDEGRIVEVRDV